jgi:oligopeptide/dipeptide ABC transporter ATP-binding protein
MAQLQQKHGLAMLFISHDLAVVSQVASRVAVMYGGSIVETGTAAQIFKTPFHPYTRGLLSAVPRLKTDSSRPLQAIAGYVPNLGSHPPGCPFEPRCELRVAACQNGIPPLVEVEPGHSVRCPVVAR